MRTEHRVEERPPTTTRLELRRGRSPAGEIFVWSRLAIWGAAVFAFLTFEPNRQPAAGRWDVPALTHDLGWLTDVWARWDSVFFLRIAEHGYDAGSHADAAFYPLYPALVAVAGRLLGGHFVLGGILVSLAACLGAFCLLFRIAESHLGADGARRAVLYLAVFPMTLFLGAVYSESLFLFLALASFALASRGRFLGAGAAAGLALLTRVTGLALLPALLLIALRAPNRARALAELTVAPALGLLYPLFLWREVGDPLAFARDQGTWHRHLSPAGPFGGLWDGLRAGVAAVRQLASGSHAHSYWPVLGTDPMRAAAVNLETLAFTGLFLALTVVAWRRFGAPYGIFTALSLALPLSMPSDRWPLLSMPRFGLVAFPLFLALAALGGRPRMHTAIVSVSAVMLGVALSQWALWQWVA